MKSNERAEQVEEQARIRSNIEAVGNTSRQGQEYLKQLAELDAVINGLRDEIMTMRDTLQKRREDYRIYLESLSFE